jgi:hypothetical protein
LTGKHEPPSGATFYISLATATLRAGLIVVALAIGVFVLSRAFPETQSPTPQSTGTPIVPSSPESSPSPEDETPSPSPPASPEVEGVRLAVLNGTSETGLAASAAQDLRARGYRVDDEDVGNAQGTYKITTLFFRRDSRLEAQHLRNTVFEGARLERAPAELVEENPGIRIIVALGQDWADKP